MGQKVNPAGMRIGINRSWDSRWISRRDYSTLLHQDIKIRKLVCRECSQAGISRVIIERAEQKVRVNIHASRPGIIIGKQGTDVEKLKKKIMVLAGNDVAINIIEIRKPEANAKLVADNIAQQIERRGSFRRAMKRAIHSAMRLGALGIRINCSGRLGGAEIARMEWSREGRIPLHSLKSDVDFGVGVANTTYGTCGVKVWIYNGDKKGFEVDSRD
ncbi:MAG: 30S ribosomal protein S3 [Holosporales bacterium]|jgi:small subunit ribosomal protein S3|nr:30S ribosomal protein S3 [Holosporales bacterium]